MFIVTYTNIPRYLQIYIIYKSTNTLTIIILIATNVDIYVDINAVLKKKKKLIQTNLF